MSFIEINICIFNDTTNQEKFIPGMIDLNEVETFYPHTRDLEIVPSVVLCMKSGNEFVCDVPFPKFKEILKDSRKNVLPMYN